MKLLYVLLVAVLIVGSNTIVYIFTISTTSLQQIGAGTTVAEAVAATAIDCSPQAESIQTTAVPIQLENNKPFQVDPLYQAEYDRIASSSHTERCERYGYTYNESIPPRRLFMGAMVAEETRPVLTFHSTEAHGMYEVVVLSESNTTHMNTPRRLRFQHGSDDYQYLTSGIFGPKTRVIVDYWLSQGDGQMYLEREQMQRATILTAWKKAGMTWRDVGIMHDVDEVFSRDFLIAVRNCDVPQFRPNQDCRTPRIMPHTISFESSPHCIQKQQWHHPDMVIGECLAEGIGDASGRVVPVRRHNLIHGRRMPGFGAHGTEDYNAEIVASGRYPLFSGSDMRDTYNTCERRPNVQKTLQEGRQAVRAYGVAFHFHNWFDNATSIRHKYHTFAHGDRDVYKKTLSEMANDLDLMVRCAKNLPNDANPEGKKRYEMSYKETTGPRPIYFLNETYRLQRHAEIQQIVAQDEAQYGSKYNESNKAAQ